MNKLVLFVVILASLSSFSESYANVNYPHNKNNFSVINYGYRNLNDSAKTITITLNDGTEIIGVFLEQDSVRIRVRIDTTTTMSIAFNAIKKIEGLNTGKTEEEIEEKDLTIVVLENEKEYKGKILEDDSLKLKLQINNDSIVVFKKADIYDYFKESMSEKYDNISYAPDPNCERLFIGPTARPIRKNRIVFADAEVFFPYVGIGIENVLSIDGGISLPYPEILYFNVKATPLKLLKNEIKYIDVALGIMVANFLYTGYTGYAGTTIGTPNISFTGGIGFPLKRSYDNNYIIMLGGDVRIINKFKIMTENWINTVKNGKHVSLLGFRVYGTNASFDLAIAGIWGNLYSSEMHIKIPIFPYGSFKYNFDLKWH